MGRIITIDNPLDLSSRTEEEYTGAFIDYLTEHYPHGFSGPHMASFNLKCLQVKNYDRHIGSNDTVVLAIGFAEPGMLVALGAFLLYDVAPALAMAALATGLNFAVNKLFGPKGTKPKTTSATNTDGASPTYTLGTPTNVARIGQPIPVAYGRNLIVPDLASTPYRFFSYNNEYVALLFCLGMGEFEIHDVLVGDTSVWSLAPGVMADLRIWGPWDHGQQFGIIQDTIGWASGFRENMYTSPEVSDQELIAVTQGNVTKPRTHVSPASIYNNDYSGGEKGIFILGIPAPSIMEGPPTDTDLWVRVSNSGANDGIYLVGTLISDTNQMLIHGQLANGVAWAVKDTDATLELSFDSSFSDMDDYTGPGTKIGPFNVGGHEVQTNIIYCDVTLPALYATNTDTGDLVAMGVNILFVSELLDENGNYVSQSGQYYHHFEAATRSPIKQTLAWEVPMGRHRVWGRRESTKGPATTESSVYWVGLRGNSGNPFLSSTNNLTYEHTTLISVIARANEGLASDALSRFSVDCTRKLELADGSRLVTRNPAPIFQDEYTNFRYGGKRPVTELDLQTLNELGNKWEGTRFFDAVFDQPATLWEALGLTLQMQHAAPTLIGSVVSIVEDTDHTVGTFALTEDTITNLSLTYLFSDGEEPDGVEGEYRDSRDNAALYACWPETAVNPEQIPLWGCRDYNVALDYVKQRWNQLVYRRRLITLETELEGHVLVVGQPITVRHPLLGTTPILCVVHAVKPKDAFSVTVDLHIHQSEVYA